MADSQTTLAFHDAVAVLTLNRPAALNSLTTDLVEELWAVLTKIGPDVRVLILTGAGRAFSAGGDIRDMQAAAWREAKPEAFFDAPLRRLHQCVQLITEAPYPVIAAVNGVAAGGGCNLALACDIIIAAESARFNQAFVKIGLAPDCGGTFFLPRLIGSKRAAELFMTGDFIDAKRAAEMGMINKVVRDDELMNTALALAQRLAAGATQSIAAIKNCSTKVPTTLLKISWIWSRRHSSH